ncbi:colanic acid biosynthesis glycosyltransferase WcaI [Croceicoccus ponticola]|uniref:Colanic acid biosynthesis glycosyltransferase WcaI n=1 Tax=Croceicoccus ponticola TaxID=2217664 RepID=A0A437GY47_9SPHN|nr:WcaI family glycosyltransferase [Croceicoccus ponticola]RVQ67588.1 colanic acid biosynthesis glycosyltransferase WcaI [Croceicoccus ponticola]
MNGRTSPRLLIVGLNYAPELVGIGPYTTGLAEGLVQRGWTVDAVVGQPYYPQWARHPDAARGWSHTREGGVGVTRCPHYIPADPSGPKRLVHHASFAASAFAPALRRARATRPDFVLAVAPSLLSVPIARLAARAAGAKLWVHLQDFEVDAAFATGLLKEGAKTAGAARRAERAILNSADLLTTISEPMAQGLRRRTTGTDVAIVRNWANHMESVADASGDAYRREWGLGERRVALYSGNIGNKQGLEIVIEAAKRLRHREDLVFVVCGNGPNRARLEAQGAGLANLLFHDLQPAERVGELLRLADIHLLPQLPGAADLVLPSKLTNMLASSRPTVATADAGTGLAVEVEGCGLIVAPQDVSAFAAAIERLCDDPALAKDLGQRAGRRARERWSRDAIVAEADALLRERIA